MSHLRLDRIQASLFGPSDAQIAAKREAHAKVLIARINGRMKFNGEAVQWRRPGLHEGHPGGIVEVSFDTPPDQPDGPNFNKRLTLMNLHPKQLAGWRSAARFNLWPCGRRSGKTEMVKRKRVKTALRYPIGTRGRVVFGAPVWSQAKGIFWDDVKAMIPKALVKDVSESENNIILYNGVHILVTGMDEPRRVEGVPLLGISLDEFGDTKPIAWENHVRPALTDTQGWADIFGVPEGRNHYYDMVTDARGDEEWEIHHWTTEEVLPYYLGIEAAAKEIASAKRRMDPLTYQQEYLASFVSFEGRAYYQFDIDTHCKKGLRYDPEAVLIFCFDFNVAPGVAVVCQEMDNCTQIIGEVYIPRNSNTPAVCRKLLAEWGSHPGYVHVYGDATGGAQGSNAVDGSDWELVKKTLRPVFQDRLRMRVPSSNPRERVRVNSVNSRLKSTDGVVGVKVDPSKAPMIIKDFEGVRLLEGGSGEIDKRSDPKLTHISDAFGYYIAEKFPIKSKNATSFQQF